MNVPKAYDENSLHTSITNMVLQVRHFCCCCCCMFIFFMIWPLLLLHRFICPKHVRNPYQLYEYDAYRMKDAIFPVDIRTIGQTSNNSQRAQIAYNIEVFFPFPTFLFFLHFFFTSFHTRGNIYIKNNTCFLFLFYSTSLCIFSTFPIIFLVFFLLCFAGLLSCLFAL